MDENAKFCPQCGREQIQEDLITKPASMATATPLRSIENENKSPHNTLAIVGFVISLISLILNFFGLVGIAAVIVSVLGLLKVDTYNGNGKSMSITGIVIGSISVFYGLISIV